MQTKQIIVMRKDLNMRRGKQIAQGSHASIAFLTKGGGVYCNLGTGIPQVDYFMTPVEETHVQEINHWLRNSFRKICVYVNSEEELEAVHQKALDNGLMSHMIVDNGATEFNGVKTKTCCAIGPHIDERFVGITDHLPLL
jgi:PTH2 family peptidyl-tRNA hydrolase